MTPAGTIDGVFDAIQQAKAGAPGYCTNFFPVPHKLQEWVEHGELLVEIRGEVALFLRQDRDFWHFYFCARDLGALGREIVTVPDLKVRRLTTDLVGTGEPLREMASALTSAGFRPYARLQRMARPGQAVKIQPSVEGAAVVLAEKSDSRAILELLEKSFDRFADQLPLEREIEAAIESRQVLAIKSAKTLSAVLYFETQGQASAIRYWTVDGQFRDRRFGSILMRHYLESHAGVRRFTLWVAADNQNAIEKYRHYDYAPDGLVDQVLVNEMITA